MSTTSHSEAKANQAITESTSSLSNIDLGGGVVHIDSILSNAKVISDGVKAVVTGGTTLSGVTVAGVPVFIDQDGAHVATMGAGGNPLKQVLDAGVAAALKTAGITFDLPGPIKKVADAEGNIVATGLIVTLDDGPLVALIPPGSGLPADPTGKTTIVLGQAAASASAAGAFGDIGSTLSDAGVGGATPPSSPSGDVLGESLGAGGGSSSALSPVGGTPATSPAPAADVTGATPAAAVGGTPISLGLVFALLLFAVLGAVGLRRFAAAVLEPAAVTTCALESKRE